MTNLNDTITGLRARRDQIQPELDALRDGRGAAALKAATSGDAQPLDELDGRIATLERELGDVGVALTEAVRLQGEQADRDRINASKAAVKALPAAVKKLAATHAGLFKAIEGAIKALAEVKEVEREVNALAADALPFDPGVGDAFGRNAFQFRHSAGLGQIVEQAVHAGSTEAVAQRIAEDAGATLTRIQANAEIRQQKLEQKLADQRAGRKASDVDEQHRAPVLAHELLRRTVGMPSAA
jgi:hypothetical protein